MIRNRRGLVVGWLEEVLGSSWSNEELVASHKGRLPYNPVERIEEQRTPYSRWSVMTV